VTLRTISSPSVRSFIILTIMLKTCVFPIGMAMITLDFEHYYWIESGIDEALFGFWLTDIDFCIACKEHCEWVSRLEEEIERDWETFGEKIYYRDVSDPELHYQALQAREDHIQSRG
jgi:hypothetical protein